MLNPLGRRPVLPRPLQLHIDRASAQVARQAWDVATTALILDNYQDLLDRGERCAFLVGYFGTISELRERQSATPGFLGQWAAEVEDADQEEREELGIIVKLFAAR